MLRTIWGKGNGRVISGFAVNRGAVYRGFTVFGLIISARLDDFYLQNWKYHFKHKKTSLYHILLELDTRFLNFSFGTV